MPVWDLPALLPDPQSSTLGHLLDGALADARGIAEELRGRVAGLDAAALSGAIRRYEHCVARVDEVTACAELLHEDAATRARAVELAARCDRAWGELAATLAFFETELAEWTCDDPEGLGVYRHFVNKVQAGASYLLTDAEEGILARLRPTGGQGWGRLAQRLLAGIAVSTEAGSRSIGEALPALYTADRDTRQRVHAAICDALAGQVELCAFALAMVVADGEVRAELRGTDWLHERRVLDQVAAGELDGLLAAADECKPLVHAYYTLKRDFLALDDFADFDRYAPLGSVGEEVSFAAATDVALAAMESVSPVFLDLARKMVDGGRIDARPRPGKKRSAYTQAIPGRLPLISMNFTGKPRDVLTLTHELGHAVYLQLAAGQPYLAATPTSVLAETVALFCEGVAVRRLLARGGDPAARLSWLARWLEDQMVAIGRQATLHRFEAALRDQARDGDTLGAQRVGELWLEEQRRLYGPAVRLTDGYRLWWSYLEPLFTNPGSNYAYVYGQLSALALLQRFETDPDGLGRRLVETLRLGDTRPPAELLALVTGQSGEIWRNAAVLLASRLGELRALIDFRSFPRSGLSTP